MDPSEKFYRHVADSAQGWSHWLIYHRMIANVLSYSLLSDIQEQIGQLTYMSGIGGERQEATDHILAGLSKLQNEVADAAEFTPAYVRRQYAEVRHP
jgi:hypothetical protein